jgi:hypothetical protein
MSAPEGWIYSENDGWQKGKETSRDGDRIDMKRKNTSGNWAFPL